MAGWRKNLPFRFLIILGLSIFISEALIMLFIDLLPPISKWSRAAIDAALLLIIVSPSLYLFLFRPLSSQIEERKQAEGELTETKRYLTSLIENSSATIISTDRAGNVVLFNKGAEELLDYSRKEVEGRYVSVLYESTGEAKEVMRRMRRGDGTVTALETNLRRKDGQSIPILISASILYDEHGQEAGTVGFSKDLRERIKAEAELQQAHEELRGAYEALQRAQSSAITSEKLAAIGRLTAGVSHEVLNPLNIILLRLHMMINDSNTPPEMIRHLRTLQDQANRIAKISQDLLSYARQRSPERSQLCLNETVRRTLGLLDYGLSKENIDLELKLADRLPPVEADVGQLQQVILNMLTNSQDAMPRGGQIVLNTDEVHVNGENYVELRLKDTGVGIDPEHMDKLFDPFFTTKGDGEGTGLGLSVCKGIVEAHGGNMWAESEHGRGATFVIQLPSDGSL